MRVKPILLRALVTDKAGATTERTINLEDLLVDWMPRHDRLTDNQRQRLSTIYDVVGKYVGGWHKERWVESFRCNEHVDREIVVWECIVRTFYAARRMKIEKRILANAITMISTRTVDVSAHTGLTDSQVNELRELYQSNAVPPGN